ncbi:MAG TPA: bifunctional glutamate N-acetyltransferase/amino-acid acetyltransferase ArgJ [Gammaproteobacteria bacterium]|nr:bifunctional glutamate N-acetyltransferase/amino-acid acetyltransferase ArgJ [Gammaproteobacteria bacterium]
MAWELDLSKLTPIAGMRLGTACAGIKRPDRDDITLIAINPGAACAAVFTRNVFCAAPVRVARAHLRKNTRPRYLLINSGNANAGTGEHGHEQALLTCRTVAEQGQCAIEAVLPFSTGVIGEPLPTARIDAAIPKAFKTLSPLGWQAAARAIMTTDTVPKGYSKTIDIGGHGITVTGIAKGAGMIRPDLATMLAFIATDAAVRSPLLNHCLRHAVSRSFNRITIDGDTSTNDACVLIATGKTPLPRIGAIESDAYRALQAAVEEVCVTLAQAIVRDGEGATKFISIEVIGGRTEQECLQVAYCVAHSPLVKTAFFASDPNWGRILAAVGRAGLGGDLDIRGVSIYLDAVCVVQAGARAEDYTEEQGRAVMACDDIPVRVHLHRGEACTTVWTCDLSYDYVKINADYRT